MASAKALLALEDGTVFEGTAFGALDVSQVGEICFNTSMTGYQEVLTDPSYRGQIVSMTYPLIGNYGVNPTDCESDQPHVRGFVIEELCHQPSNWRSVETLDAYLQRYGIPGIEGIDTRSLTKRIRESGAMRAVLTTVAAEAADPDAMVARAKDAPSMEGSDLVKEVSTETAYRWDEDDTESRRWTLTNPSQTDEQIAAEHEDERGQRFAPLPEIKYHIIAYDNP